MHQLSYILSSPCQLHYYTQVITSQCPTIISCLDPELPCCLSILLFSWPRLIFYQKPAGVAPLSRLQRMPASTRLQQWLTLFLCHFSLCIIAMALWLISFEGLTAVRRSGRTNRQLISFSGLPPEAKFWPLSLSLCCFPLKSPLSLSFLMGH